jgi:ornithine cyclodeaminase/alanine dehydrogenase-like protein (mu-crystallin family)
MATKMPFLFLSKKDLQTVWSMDQTLKVVEQTLRWMGEGQVEQRHCVLINSAQNCFSFILPHPAYIKPWNVVGDKWLGVSAGNPEKGLPYAVGMTIINDSETLAPLAVMDAGYLTTMRTAGMAAIGAKFLARRNAEVLAIVGCGMQGRTHLEAILGLNIFKFRTVRVYDRFEQAMRTFKADMEQRFAVTIETTASVEACVSGADVVMSVTTTREPILFDQWLKPGSHLAATCLYDVDIRNVLPRADKWVLGDTERDRRWFENPDARTKFNLSIDQVYGDLVEVVCGKKPGRERDEERTNMTHLGMGAMDVAVGYQAYLLAKAAGLGISLELEGE